jgi:hypothetical protein
VNKWKAEQLSVWSPMRRSDVGSYRRTLAWVIVDATNGETILMAAEETPLTEERARFLAAAPEMYEALKELLEVSEDALDGIDEWDTRGTARAAIAKAELPLKQQEEG